LQAEYDILDALDYNIVPPRTVADIEEFEQVYNAM
jgi:hypothetical protein